MTDLKKLKKLDLVLPESFEQSVWKTIYTRMPARTADSSSENEWGDVLWRQPAWLGGLVCVVLLTGMALGQFNANLPDGNQSMAQLYINSIDQGDSIL